MLIQSDEGGKRPADLAQWLYSVTKQESFLAANDFLIDSGAATSACQQSLADTEDLEWSSVQPHDISSQRLATRDDVNVASHFQIALKNIGLQRSIISVGQVCDRGSVITFRSTGGTILNEFTGNRIEFERAGGVYRLRVGTSAKMKSGPGGVKGLMGFEEDSAGATEAQSARPEIVPVLPSEAEVEQHELTHLPFRSWCRHCARAKGKECPHHESGLGSESKFATDYMFMGEDGTPITILAGYDALAKALFANVVPCKGTSHGYAERALARNVLSTGHQKVILQSDQEPSIIDVKHMAGPHIPTEIVYEESPVGDCNANENIEQTKPSKDRSAQSRTTMNKRSVRQLVLSAQS